MKERPIIKGHEIAGRMPLFKLPLRDAIREDRKSMTRRVIKPQPDEDGLSRLIEKWLWQDTSGRDYICPHGIPGQFRVMTEPLVNVNGFAHYDDDKAPVISMITNTAMKWRWSKKKLSSIHMPYEAARTVTEYTGVSVERVQDITEKDAIAEGISKEELNQAKECGFVFPGVHSFYNLWNLINAKRGFGWDENNWVWCIEFRRV